MSDSGDRPEHSTGGTGAGPEGPARPDPTTPDPATPDPATPDPATPDPATPGPATTADTTGAPGTAAGPSDAERQWALFAHLSALAGFIVPFGNLIGPLVIWQIKKAEMPFVDEQGKEALNFQITVTLAAIVSGLLMIIAIGLLLLPIVIIGAIVLAVVAAVKANGGEHYRYPMTWRPIS